MCVSWAQLIWRKSGSIIHTALLDSKGMHQIIPASSAPISRPIAWTRNSLRFGQTAFLDSGFRGILMDSHWYVIAIGLFERDIKTWSLLIKEHQCFYLMGKSPSLMPTFCKSILVSFSESNGQPSFMHWHVLKWSSISTPRDERLTYKWSMMILQVTSRLVTHVCVSLWYLICITVRWSHDNHLHPFAVFASFEDRTNCNATLQPIHLNNLVGLQVPEQYLSYTPVKPT